GDGLGHRRHVGADGGNTACHSLEQRLSHELRDAGLVAEAIAVNARQDDAASATVRVDQLIVTPVTTEGDLLPGSKLEEQLVIGRVSRWAENLQLQLRRERLDESVDSLVRQKATNEEGSSSLFYALVGFEPLRIDPGQDDVRPGLV